MYSSSIRQHGTSIKHGRSEYFNKSIRGRDFKFGLNRPLAKPCHDFFPSCYATQTNFSKLVTRRRIVRGGTTYPHSSHFHVLHEHLDVRLDISSIHILHLLENQSPRQALWLYGRSAVPRGDAHLCVEHTRRSGSIQAAIACDLHSGEGCNAEVARAGMESTEMRKTLLEPPKSSTLRCCSTAVRSAFPGENNVGRNDVGHGGPT